VNVRVVAATHRSLEEMIEEKQFRDDLYYRLNVFPIYIPPLRERPEDIPLLVRHFVHEFARRMNKAVGAISPQTMDALIHYSWPGNIRELQNVIERSVVVYRKGNFSVKKSSFSGKPFHHTPTRTPFRRSATEDRRMIDLALAEAGGRVSGPSGAAALLGIPPSTLESKIRSMNINKYSFKTSGRTLSPTLRISEPIELL
jgi:transcriptional regulator with GAF, ATPase, and Fis domain